MRDGHRILCRAVQYAIGIDGTAPVDQDGAANWGDVRNLADDHAVVPQVHRLVSEQTSSVPSAVRAGLSATANRITKRTLQLTGELSRVLSTLDSAEIPTLAYKGPALAALAYGEFAARQFIDLDLLVPEAEIEAAVAELVDAGYRPMFTGEPRDELTAVERRAIRVSGPHVMLFHPEEQLIVELHWRVAKRGLPRCPGLDDAFESPATVSVGGQTVPTLPPGTALLAACLHATTHAWSRLKWVGDVAALIRNCDIDLASVIERARAAGFERMLAVGTWLAVDTLSLAVPRSVERLWERQVSQDQVECIQSSFLWASREDVSVLQRKRFVLWSLSGMVDRARFGLDYLFRPTGAEASSLLLPVALFPLYYLYRPLWLASRGVSTIISG